MSRSRSFTSIQTFHTHTHTPCLRQSCLYAMRWRWGWMGEWRWAESENDMKDYLTGTRGGERKRRGESKHPHQHTWPGAGKPWKGKGKEKRRPTDTEKDQRRGGRTEAPEPTYHSETYAYLGTHRTQPTWGGKNAWNRGQNGELVGEEELKQQNFKWDSVQT